MPKRNPAEFLLSLAVGPTRAASISGDLLELAATNGRLWYYTTYIRTLVSLTWRIPATFLIAAMLFIALDYLNMQFGNPWRHLTPAAHDSIRHAYIIESITYLNLQLWFLAPFAAFKYGLDDRFTRFTLSAALIGTCAFHFVTLPGFALTFACLAVAALVSLSISPRWRGPVITATTAAIVGYLTFLNLSYLAHLYCWIDEHKPLNETSHYHYFEIGYAFRYTLFWTITWTIAFLDMLVVSNVYTHLHRRFSRLPSAKSEYTIAPSL